MKRISLLALGTIILTSSLSIAQEVRKGREASKADVNFTEMANYELAHPAPNVRKHQFEEDDVMHPIRPEVDPSKVFLYTPPAAADERSRRIGLPVSPAPTDTFLSTVSDGNDIPPDTHGAVDSHYCVTAINPDVHIQTRTGANVSTVTEDHFWSAVLPHGAGSFDPRIHYDPYSGRWIIACLAYGETANSQLMIGVSATGNPTGTWHIYNVVIDPTGVNWLDFDNIGFNKQWIVLCGNLFNIASGSSPGAQVYVFDKASIMAGTGAPYTMFNENGAFCITPALTYDSSESSLYMLEIYNGARGQLQEWKVSGTATAPTVTALGNPATTLHWNYTSYANSGSSGADFAPQAGTTNLIQTNDDRINNCVERNGSLWCSHNVFLPYSATANPTRCSVMWWQIDTGGTVQQNGVIDDPTNTNFYAFGNIAVNSTNDALIGYSGFSAATYPDAKYRLHMHTDPADSMRPEVTFRHGQANYYETFGGSQNRWGDYSGTCVDPLNETDFWTIQESVPTSPANYWDTWWAYVQVCPIPTASTLAVQPLTACAGATNLFVAGNASATSYTWTVTGSGWTSTTSTTDSINITTGTGIATITVTGSSACGTGPVATFTVASATAPGIPTVGTAIAPCVGAALATYTASSTYATSYTWNISGTGWTGTSTTGTLPVTIGTGVATLTCVAVNACGSSPTFTEEISAIATPVAADTISVPKPVCSGSSITLVTPAIPSATGYVWSISGTGWSGTSSSDTFRVTVGTTPGTITVYATNGCGSGAPYTVTTGLPVPIPALSYSALHTVMDMGNLDTFTFTGVADPSLRYSWRFGVGSIPDSATGTGMQTALWTLPGLKDVTITVIDSGCTETYVDTVLVINNVGIAGINSGVNTFRVLPNPNNGNFDIIFGQTVNQPFDVKIIDMNGRIVYSNHVGALNAKTYSIKTDNLTPGSYNVNLYFGDDLYSNKITITE